MEDRQKVIAVDFDGTIVENDFPAIGSINQHVVDLLIEEYETGAVIILWTTRQNESLRRAKDFIEENDIPVDYINENVPWLDFETSRKIFADVYIDDRCMNPFTNNLNCKIELASEDEVVKTLEVENEENE